MTTAFAEGESAASVNNMEAYELNVNMKNKENFIFSPEFDAYFRENAYLCSALYIIRYKNG